jgi:hypothetical protein
MRSPTASMNWEQKIVTQCLKTVLINAFISYRLLKAQHMLESSSSFKSLAAFRIALNAVESFPTFLFEASSELTTYATFLRERNEARFSEVLSPSIEIVGVKPDEAARLKDLAKRRKRNRLEFFNSDDGISLRLVFTVVPMMLSHLVSLFYRLRVQPHQTMKANEGDCCLCGNNLASSGHRGSRSFT